MVRVDCLCSSFDVVMTARKRWEGRGGMAYPAYWLTVCVTGCVNNGTVLVVYRSFFGLWSGHVKRWSPARAIFSLSTVALLLLRKVHLCIELRLITKSSGQIEFRLLGNKKANRRKCRKSNRSSSLWHREYFRIGTLAWFSLHVWERFGPRTPTSLYFQSLGFVLQCFVLIIA